MGFFFRSIQNRASLRQKLLARKSKGKCWLTNTTVLEIILYININCVKKWCIEMIYTNYRKKKLHLENDEPQKENCQLH